MKKLIMLAGVGIGYVLGTRAGRERYDEIMQMFGRVKDDPRVREKAHQASDFAKEQAPRIKDSVRHTVSDATSGSSNPDPAVGDEKLHPDSTHFQSDPYPKGDLP